jgi:hypothetical protein
LAALQAVDLPSITAVHPIRGDAVDAFPVQAGAGRPTVRRLVERGHLVETIYEG